MPTTTAFSLTIGGVPFAGDRAHVVNLNDVPEHSILLDKQLPEVDLYSEISRLIPLEWMRDYCPSPPDAYRLQGIARQQPCPPPFVDIGRWYYPTGASRWSVFRGLMTSAMVVALRTATSNYTTPASFVIQAAPNDPTTRLTSAYSITTSMSALPPRPLGENGGSFPGLYLVTLVDERWYYQGTTVTIHPTPTATWEDLIAEIADALNVTIAYSAISSDYSEPEPDSPLWANKQDAAVLLDAVAANIGRVCVREYDGSLTLLTWAETQARIATNRGTAPQVVRMAGGDLFTSGQLLPVGNQTYARNAVVPQQVTVTFPKYITGNDPVPHYFNPRTSGQQPTTWDESSYGDVYSYSVPITSGGVNVSGLTGTSEETLRTTAKALYATEAAASGLPTNDASLGLLATSVVTAYYDSLVVPSLDEVYPGTFAWVPEGGHDLVFTYSERLEQASLRVVRSAWNSQPSEFQHSTPGVSYVAGIGGKRVPQTWLQGGTSQYGVNLVKLGAGLTLSVSGTTGGINEVLLEGTGNFPPTSGSIVNYNYLTNNFINNTFNFSGTNVLNIGSGSVVNVSGGGFFTFYAPLQICGYQFWCCAPVDVTGDDEINNWDLPATGGPATMYTVEPGAPTIINGIVSAYSGKPQIIGLVNVLSGKELRLMHDDPAANTFNEILLPSAWSGSSMSLFNGDTAILWWDECDAEKWRVISTTAELVGTGDYQSFGAMVEATLLTSQSINSATFTPLDWGTIIYDNDGFTDGTSDALIISDQCMTSGTAGIFDVGAYAAWFENGDSNISGSRELQIRINSGIVAHFRDSRVPSKYSGTVTAHMMHGQALLNSGDIVHAYAWQDTGSTLSVLGLRKFWIKRLEF